MLSISDTIQLGGTIVIPTFLGVWAILKWSLHKEFAKKSELDAIHDKLALVALEKDCSDCRLKVTNSLHSVANDVMASTRETKQSQELAARDLTEFRKAVEALTNAVEKMSESVVDMKQRLTAVETKLDSPNLYSRPRSKR